MKNTSQKNKNIRRLIRRNGKIIALILSVLIAFCTTYMLILPAITVDLETADEMNGLVVESLPSEETAVTEVYAEVVSAEETAAAEESVPEVAAAAEESGVQNLQADAADTSAVNDVQTEGSALSEQQETVAENTVQAVEDTQTAEQTESTETAATDEDTASEDVVPNEAGAEEAGADAAAGNVSGDPAAGEVSEENVSEDAAVTEENAASEDAVGTEENAASEDAVMTEENAAPEGETTEEEASAEDETAEDETSEDETSEEETSEEESEEAETEESDDAVSPLVYETERYTVEVSFDETAEIPEGTKLIVEVKQDSEDPAELEAVYQHYFDLAAKGMEELETAESTLAELYVLSFENEDGPVQMPEVPYDITIKFTGTEDTVYSGTHLDEIIRTGLFSLSADEAVLADRNADETYTVETDANGVIRSLSLKQVSFTDFDQVIGLFAGREEEESPAQFFEETLDQITVSVEAPEGAFPANTEMQVALVEPEDLPEDVQTVSEGEVKAVAAVDITFVDEQGNEIQPAVPVKVSVTMENAGPEETSEASEASEEEQAQTPQQSVIHIADDGSMESVEAEQTEDSLVFEAEQFSIYVIVETVTRCDFLTADGDTMKVTVTFSENEIIPEGAILEIKEVTAEDEAYPERNARLADVLCEEYGNVTISDVHFTSINILVNGEEYEPEYPVEIKAEYKDVLYTENTAEYIFDEEGDPSVVPVLESTFVAVHYGENGGEILESTTESTDTGITESVSITPSFSDYDYAYIYQYETYEAGDNYNLSAGGLLSAADVSLMTQETGDTIIEEEEVSEIALMADDGTGTEGETEDDTTSTEPDHEKTLTDNKNGTYTLSLSVTGDADTESITAADVNVVIVYDVSNSMTANYVPLTYGGYGLDTSSGGGAADGTYFQLYQNTSGTEAYDGYTGTVYRRTQSGQGPRATYSYTEYTGQRYSTYISRAEASEKVLYDFTHSLFSYQDQTDDPTNIEAALVTFSGSATTTQGWTSTETDITGLVSSTGTDTKLTYSQGTNWEDALDEAYSLLQALDKEGDSDPTFVIFITDGKPTASNTDVGQNADSEDYYVEALDEALAIEKYCASTEGAFFGIYAYGKETDYLASLMYYAYNGNTPDSTIEGTTFDTTGYYNASDTDALTSAISDIFQQIVETLGVGSATITDGTTSSVATTSGEIADLLEVNEDSYQYWLSWPVTSNGDGTYTFAMNDPLTAEAVTYTVTVSGSTVTISWTEDDTAKNVTYSGSVSSGNVLTVEWTAATDFYNYIPPTAYYDASSSSVIWNLNTLGTLLDGVTYTVTFEVYPSQTTLDIIADLMNGKYTYESLDANIKKYLLYDEDTGSYTLLTNTEAYLTYTDSRTDDGEQTATYDTPDPVSTAAEQMTVKKLWYNTLYNDDDDIPESMTLYITRDGTTQYTATLAPEKWEDTIYISIGIITVDNDGTVTIKTTGHNYSFAEPAELEYYWDLEVPTVRPMLINNVLTMLVLIEDSSEVPEALSSLTTANGTVSVNGTTYYKLTINGTVMYYMATDKDATLTASNYRRSYLDVVKVVDSENAPSDDTFALTMSVTNSKEAKGSAEDTASDYYVWFSIWDTDAGALLTDTSVVTAADDVEIGYEYQDGSFTGYFYVPSGTTITVAMKTSYSLRFLNLPEESTYTVSETLTEAQEDAGYSFGSIAGTRSYYYNSDDDTVESGWTSESTGTVDGQSVSGTIDNAESAYKVTVTNNYSTIDVQLKKVDEDDKTLSGSTFTLAAYSDGAWSNVETDISPGGSYTETDEEGNITTGTYGNPIDLGDLGIGRYRLTETTAPDGYIILTKHVYFEVYKDTDGALQVRLTDKDGNVLTDEDGNVLTEEDGIALTSETNDGVTVYTMTVSNTPGFALPSTGGSGTLPYTAGGIALLVGAAVMYGFRMRRRERRSN